jgi:mono/diheme cytochrome c family protein
MSSVRKATMLGLAASAIGFGITGAGLRLPAEAAAGGNAAAQLSHGRQLFNDWACGTCHALRDAGASGQVGPSLDGNKNMNKAFVVSRIANGAGAMPGFAGQMSDKEIGQLADYILKASRK